MKIGLFIDTWYPMVDGVIKVVDNYARRLMKYADVVVFCPETRGYDKEEDEKMPYKVLRCSSIPLIRSDYDIPTPVLDPVFEAQLIGSGIDIVHIHSPFSVSLAGVLYAKLHGLPLVATLHSQYKQDFEKPLKFKPAVNMAMDTIMRVFNACDECWAVNEGIRDLYLHEYGLTAPCKVRLNATDHLPVADPAEAARRVNEAYGIPADATVFLFVGRINFIKNIDFTDRALAKAKKLGLNNFRMLFVGQGQDAEKLAEVVREEGLQEEVVLCGLVSDKSMLESLYSRAKLFLFPSLYDANSLVQIEAACQGTPTLFLEGARTAATVTPGVNGYISAPGEEQYARAILDALADKEAYKRLSQAARRDLYLNWDDVVRDVYADYKRLAKVGDFTSINIDFQEITELTPALAQDLLLLMQQLSPQKTITEEMLRVVVESPESHLYAILDEGRAIACATLCVYHSPTGCKASVEDVIVLSACRGKHLGEYLMQRVIAAARAWAPIDLHLTSRPSRGAANALYRKLGFLLRETNPYSMTLEAPPESR